MPRCATDAHVSACSVRACDRGEEELHRVEGERIEECKHAEIKEAYVRVRVCMCVCVCARSDVRVRPRPLRRSSIAPPVSVHRHIAALIAIDQLARA
jgi:hypothetical protein